MTFTSSKSRYETVEQENMFKVKKNDTRATSVNYMFMSIDAVLVYFFVNLGHILNHFLVFLLLTLNR